MRAITKEVFKFDELSDAAKEKARDWYRANCMDYEWWDDVFDQAKECGRLIGIDIDRIYFSGFWSQGDGACFEGFYYYAKGGSKAIREYSPNDTELHRIADELQRIQRKHFYKLAAAVKHSGHYYHEYCTSIVVEHSEDTWRDIGEAEEDIKEALRDFMRWIYARLQNEYEWLTADEQVDEIIRANEYEFDEEGNIV